MINRDLKVMRIVPLIILSLLLLTITISVNAQTTEDQMIEPPGGGSGFHGSVDVSDNTAVFGANIGFQQEGRAYVYEGNVEGLLVLSQFLEASDAQPSANFGLSVSISGDRIVIGAPSVPGESFGGKAYIFERDVSGFWQQVEVLTASDEVQDDRFGACVSVSEDRILVTSPNARVGETNRSGKAYIFDRDSKGNWIETILNRPEPYVFQEVFGFGCSIAGDTVVIGAPGWMSPEGSLAQGYADIYERDMSGEWNQVVRVIRPQGEQWDQLGKSVEIEGNTVIIAAEEAYKVPSDPLGITGVGTALILERDIFGTWNEIELNVVRASFEDHEKLGSDVALAGDKLILGASRSDIDGLQIGKSYVFERNLMGGWEQSDTLQPSNEVEFLNFGLGVEILPSTGSKIVVAPFSNVSFGIIYVYKDMD